MFLTIKYINNKFYFDFSDGSSYIFHSKEEAINALTETLTQRTLCYVNLKDLATHYIDTCINKKLILLEV